MFISINSDKIVVLLHYSVQAVHKLPHEGEIKTVPSRFLSRPVSHINSPQMFQGK